MTFSSKQLAALKSGVDPSFTRVRKLTDGRELPYIEGWYAISEANRIFGFDAWSRETVDVKCVQAREVRGSFQVIYLAKVRLSVRAGEHEMVREGYGTGAAASDSLGDAHEKALKSAETDATKRALATFGRPFGLALHVPANEVEPKMTTPRPAIPEAHRRRTRQRNDGCPYVRKHYGSGNMQALQKKWTDEGIVWLSVISSPPGEQGFADAARANALTSERKAAPSAVLLDPKQQVAKSFGALVTPHMYIITPDGTLAYAGAIDDKPTARTGDIKGATNYVDNALSELKSGKPVATPTSRAYGCVVKYSS